MLMQFNDNKSKEYGDATLIRKDKVIHFKYQQAGARQFTVYDAVDGFVNVKANQTIVTRDDLNFVKGDRIQLDTLGIELKIQNFTKEINAPQLMYLATDYSVVYTLDLG